MRRDAWAIDLGYRLHINDLSFGLIFEKDLEKRLVVYIWKYNEVPVAWTRPGLR